MKKLTPNAVRTAMIASGVIHPDSRKPETIMRHKAPVPVSRLNAILARRVMVAH